MSQHDLVTETAGVGGEDFGLDIEAALRAVASLQAGMPLPATTYPNMAALDTTEAQWVQNFRTTADDAWLPFLMFDSAGNKVAGIGPIAFADARAEIPSKHFPPSTTVILTAGYATPSDGGAARYKRVGAEPSHEWKVQSADGAWWELVPDAMGVNVKQLGAKGDNSTDDFTAFDNACNNGPDLNASGVNEAHHTVIVPSSALPYYIGSALQLKKFVHILGPGSGLDNTPKPAKLRFDANTTGIIVHTFNTIDATTEGTGTGSSGGSIIEGLHLDSDGGTIAGVTDDAKGHGVWMRGRAMVRNCIITDFPGNGINIVAASGGSGGVTEGNANGWRIDGARISGCHQNGVFVTGADSNAGVGQGIDVSGCGRAGIADHSFLGNTWVAPEVESCGIANQGENGAAESSYVDFGGERYIANRGATEAELVATQPGTDKTVWIHTGSGSANITWQSSQPEGTYFVGGSYVASASNTVFFGAYHEEGQARPQVAGMLVGGLHQGNFDAAGISLTNTTWRGRFEWPNDGSFPENTVAKVLTMGFWQDDQRPFRVVADSDSALGLSLAAWDNPGGRWQFIHGNAVWMYVTSDLTTGTYGRASAFDAGYPVFERGIVIGNAGGARHMTNETAAPTAGEHARGEIYWNRDPAVLTDTNGDNWILTKWVCTVAGTPGTWVACYERTDPPGL